MREYMILQRRSFLIGLASMFAAPAIVRVQSIMPVRTMIEAERWVSFQSWPLGTEAPFPCVEGYDLVSRAVKICVLTGQNMYIRLDPYR